MKTHQQLNAIRYDLDGNGAQDTVSASDWANYTAAFFTPATGMGCKLTDHDGDSNTAEQPTCVGYELMNDIDLDTDGDGNIGTDSGDAYHNSGAGWLPIGTNTSRYATNFKGNGHTVNNLFISRSSTDYQGLFGVTASIARIETLGIINANIRGDDHIGILAGRNYGTIIACYTTGKARGDYGIGGLVGSLAGSFIRSSYTTAYVEGANAVGGLLGYRALGSVAHSYATGRVSGPVNTGGLEGAVSAAALVSAGSTVTNSYWDISTSGKTNTAAGGAGKTTRQIQTPTGYTGIYANWNANLDGVTGNDDPWTFGNKMQYPMLDYKGMSTAPQGGQAMGIYANWNAPIVGERVGVCLASPSDRGTVSGQTWKEPWIWERSDNGDTWETVSGVTVPSYEYAPTTSDVNHYLRAKVKLTDNTFAYTRALGGRVKNASGATAGSAITFVSGNTSPRVGQKIEASDPRPTGAVDARFAWQRCDNADTTYTDCEYIVHVWWTNYTPVAADVNHYLRMVVYYETSAGVWTRHATAFTGQVTAASQ